VNPEKQGNNGSGEGGRQRKSVIMTRISKPRSAAKNQPQPKVVRPVMEKCELVISLTKEEIEHDFILMTGEKPPKIFNRRQKVVQKNLDVIISLLNFYVDLIC
jgi:rRNA processing protein Krr1/Pno1